MADKLAAAQEKRQKLAKDLLALRDEFSKNNDTWPSDEKRAAFETVSKDYDATTREIDSLKAALDVHTRAKQIQEDDERRNHQPNPRTGRMPGQDDPQRREDPKSRGVSEADRELALQGWMRSQAGLGLKRRHKEALHRCKVQAGARRTDWRIAKTGLVKRLARVGRALPAGVDLEQRAEVLLRTLSAAQGTAGGVTIPEGFVTSLEVNMLAFGGILNVAEILRTASGNDMLWPTADDTSNEGEILGESTQQNTADPSFKGITFRAYKFSSKMVKVPYELLEDSAFDLALYLGQVLGERLGRAQNRKFTVGTGASEPKGIVTAATSGLTSAASGAIADTELIRLQHSVDPAYRNGGAFMMHDNVILAIRQLKDSQGRFIWQPGLVDGAPDRLLNSPVVVNQHMDSTIATTKKTVLYGQLSKYKVRQVNSVRMRRLDERYAEYDQVAFLGLVRADGNLIDAGTAPVKYLQQV